MMRGRLSRRKLLYGALGAPVALVGAEAIAAPPGGPVWDESEEGIRLDLPQLQYPGKWNPRPGAMREWAVELRLRTRLEPPREPSVIEATSARLFETPFLYAAGLGALPELGERAEAALRRFVDLGGMIFFDDAGGGTDRGFAKDVEALLGRVLPGAELRNVAHEHVLHKAFYIVDAPAGRTRASEHVRAIHDEGRLKAVFFPNDLGGALARDTRGKYRHTCSPGGEVQREWALRMATNVMLYATCTDYKADPAHVETLLMHGRQRR